MKKIWVILGLVGFLGCDDGDTDIPAFIFDGDLQDCVTAVGDNTTYVFYKTNGNEALSLQFSNRIDDFLTSEDEKSPISLSSSGSSTISYRTFNNDLIGGSYFFQNIPPSEPTIVNEWIGNGTLVLNTVLAEDDKDGVQEDIDNTDTDEDGTPNYLDRDDDGDGILTSVEAFDGDGNLKNTDGDLLPDYLDEDDDGDGILTKNEDGNGDGNINNDDDNGNGILNYLDAEDNTSYDGTPLPAIEISYTLIYTTTAVITNLNLTNANESSIRFDSYDFGEIVKEEPFPSEDDASK